jgi:hypothetical protein
MYSRINSPVDRPRTKITAMPVIPPWRLCACGCEHEVDAGSQYRAGHYVPVPDNYIPDQEPDQLAPPHDFCLVFRDAWEFWRPAIRWHISGRGRPRRVIGPSLDLHQVALFCAQFLGHLRGVFLRECSAGGTPGLRVLDHLKQQGLKEWRLSVGSLERRSAKGVPVSYFQYGDKAWGEPGVISARRWKEDVQYQAVRRLLSKRLGVKEKTLERRFNECAWWDVGGRARRDASRRRSAAQRPQQRPFRVNAQCPWCHADSTDACDAEGMWKCEHCGWAVLTTVWPTVQDALRNSQRLLSREGDPRQLEADFKTCAGCDAKIPASSSRWYCSDECRRRTQRQRERQRSRERRKRRKRGMAAQGNTT